MRRRALLALAGAPWVQAQVVPPNVAVPYYTAPAFLTGAYRFDYLPRAQAFAREASALVAAIDAACAASPPAWEPVRAQWKAAAIAWDELAALAAGPLLKRRSLRRIDFAPTRPELIERALLARPRDLKDLESIGTPAKGLPALEWLLWTRPMRGAPECAYAALLALDVEVEAQALAAEFGALAGRDWTKDEAGASAAMAELLNQWVAGLERLRWANIGKPMRSASGKPPVFPRAASGSTRESWAAQWRGLAAFGIAVDDRVPQPGQDLVSLESYLRGRGLNPLANQLAAGARAAARHVTTLSPTNRKAALDAERSLASLKRLAEAKVAPALDVHIGFSDADGD